MSSKSDLTAKLAQTSTSKPKKTTPKHQTGSAEGVADKKRVSQKNISLYPENLDTIKHLRDIVYDSTGEMLNDSLAVRIALELSSKDNAKILQAYDRLKKQDGRKR